MSGSTLPVTPGSGTAVQGSTSSSSNFLQSVGVEDKDSGVVQSVFDAGTGQHASLVASAFKELAGLTAGALNADLVASTDINGYKWVSIQITTMAAGGTIAFQGSNDNATWVGVYLNRISASTSATVSSTSTAGLFQGLVGFRYLRARLTAWTSGTTTGVVELYTVGSTPSVVGTSQQGSWTVGAAGSSAVGTAVPNPLVMGMSNGGNVAVLATNGEDGTVGSILLNVQPFSFNGSNYDRPQNNEEATFLASGARTNNTDLR